MQKHDFFERYIHYIKQIYSYAQNFAYIQKVYFYNSISVVLMQRNGTRTEDCFIRIITPLNIKCLYAKDTEKETKTYTDA